MDLLMFILGRAYCYWRCEHSPEFPAAVGGRAGSPLCYETQEESETSCLELQALSPPDSCWREEKHHWWVWMSLTNYCHKTRKLFKKNKDEEEQKDQMQTLAVWNNLDCSEDKWQHCALNYKTQPSLTHAGGARGRDINHKTTCQQCYRGEDKPRARGKKIQ